jgi:hypothetical protein
MGTMMDVLTHFEDLIVELEGLLRLSFVSLEAIGTVKPGVFPGAPGAWRGFLPPEAAFGYQPEPG